MVGTSLVADDGIEEKRLLASALLLLCDYFEFGWKEEKIDFLLF
jgi:hypothetical protein